LHQIKLMDTSANALIEELNAILADFKFNMIEAYEEHQDEIEEKVDNLAKEVNGLFDSSYQ